MTIFDDTKEMPQPENENDISVEADNDFEDIDDTEGDQLARIKKLKDELKKCTAERKEYLDGWQRTKADYLNSRKRYDEERKEVATRAETAIIERMLTLGDSFDMALAHIGSGEASALKTGFEQIYAQLRALLADYGVKEFGAEGERFDPYRHEALSSEHVDDETKHDTILRVLQKGYQRGDTVVRHAKVIIGTFTNAH